MSEGDHDLFASIIACWFEEIGPNRWYNSTPEIDAMLRERFAERLTSEGEKDVASFIDDPQTALGAILLFDQIPRNIYRGSPEAFAWDDKAQAISRIMLENRWTQGMKPQEAQFALMPLMHSEKIEDQDLSVRWFAELAPASLDYARHHREAIARFGRFPHRNEILGRETTEEERAAIEAGLSW